MLKKVVYGIVAGSLVFAAQVASAEDTQFWTGEKYQGVSALPFSTSPSGAEALRGAVMPEMAPQASARVTVTLPAPYDTPGGYFN